MDRTTRYILIAAFLGASIVASGAVGHGGRTATTTTDVGIAELHSQAVPYFPAQYTLDAPAGTSGSFSTF